jgi:hypothetical protein
MPALRTALATIHRDSRWWQKVLVGGALMLSLVGYPLAVGMVMVRIEHSRNGFPTPLPPWTDWTTRYLIGLFTLLIDFAFFLFPLAVAGMLLFCIGLFTITGPTIPPDLAELSLYLVGLAASAWLLTMFCSSVAPVARLLFAREGHIADALGMQPLRRAFSKPARRYFWRARLVSLPVYLPAGSLFLVLGMLSRIIFPGQLVMLLLTGWLLLSALLYAHLAVVQIYVAAEQEIAQGEMDIYMSHY